MTFLLFSCAITVMFLELSIVLGRNYFRNLFNDDLPFSITMMVSFVLGINGGYFTLMFIVKLFRPFVLNCRFPACSGALFFLEFTVHSSYVIQ